MSRTGNKPSARGVNGALRTVKLLLPAAACSAVPPHSHGFRTVSLGPEDVHGPDDILPADGALAHPLPAFGAGYHVTALQQHAVDDGVHADSTQVLIGRQLSLDAVRWREEQTDVSGASSNEGNFGLSPETFCEVRRKR